MSNTVAFPAPRPEQAGSAGMALGVDAAASAANQVAAADAAADRRLIIEEDEVTGAFVYKTLDRTTGEVISQLPREQVLKLREDPAYSPGQMVDSRS